jgi:hypothetical protein
LDQSNPFGDVVIRNNENAEIRDVRLFFRAANYTASEFPCGTVPIIPRGRSATLPLLADFSNDILRFTSNGRIIGELVIRYRFLGQERETVRAVTIATHDRNTIPLSDPAALAALVSPTSPETVDYGKYIAGLARNSRRTGHNENFQYAVWLLEGLRAGGIKHIEALTGEAEVRFPAETLSFRSGSSRDLALLFSACLESVGIPAAFISVNSEEEAGSDFLVAVSLGINGNAAETLFNGTEKILIVDNNVWLPLSMSSFNEGFTSAWAKGFKILNDAFAGGKQVDFVMLEEAWAVYPPAPLPEQGGRAIRTDANSVTTEVNRAMQLYIDHEIQPIVRQVQAQISTNSTAALYNRLGIVEGRAGRIADGKANYERAAGMGSVPAMTNRGSLALSENDFAAAERWFRQALQKEPGNRSALLSLVRIAENRQ